MKKIFLTSFFICSLLFLLFFSSINANASEGKINNDISNSKLSYNYGDFDNYTDSDYLLSKYSNYTIQDYKSRLWHTTLSYNLSFIINGEDPITEIIPRDFFIFRGSYLYIGYDYAFFINTKEKTKTSNLCEIMLIDIVQSYDLDSPTNPSQVVQTVKPIFQAEYLFLGSSFDYNTKIDDMKFENKSGQSSVVIPLPKHNRGDYEQINKFYLTNVGFQAGLANTQHLNQNDLDYQAIEDNGSFFTRSDMYFNGVGRKDYSKYITIVKTFAGLIPLGNGISVGDVFGFIDAIDASIDIAYSDNLRIEQSYGEYYKEIAYTSKSEQIKNYNCLLKVFSNLLAYVEETPVLFGTYSGDQYVTSKFSINTTLDWRTLINTSISFKIVDDDMNEIVYSKGYYQQELRSIEYKSFSNETSINGYHLSNMKDYFEFSSKETSYYNFTINNSSTVQVYDSNLNPLTCLNGFYKIEAGKKYLIEVLSIGTEGKFKLSAIMIKSSEINLITLSGQEYVYVKYTPTLNDLHSFLTPGGTCISLYDSNGNRIGSSTNNKLTYFLNKNYSYYLLILNYSSDIITLNLNLNNVERFELNNTINRTKCEGDNFFAFQAPTSGTYYLTSFTDLAFDFYLKNQTSIVSYAKTKSNEIDATRYRINLNKNDVLYVGKRNLINTSIKFNISYPSQYVSWYYNNSKLNGNRIVMKQNSSGYIHAKIGSATIFVQPNLTSFSSKNYEFNPSNGLLKILGTAIPTELTDAPNRIFFSFGDEIFNIDIYVVTDISVTLSTESTQYMQLDKQNGVSFSFNSPNINDKFIIHLVFIYSNKSETKEYYNSTPARSGTIYIDFTDANSFSEIQTTVRVKYIEYIQKENGVERKLIIWNSLYKDVSNEDNKITVNDLPFNTMFAGGNGSSQPFEITNERHLNNIRYATREYREDNTSDFYVQDSFVIKQSISLYKYSSWTPLPIFKGGEIEGESNTIYNMAISVTKSNSNVGFISALYNGNISNLNFYGANLNVKSTNSSRMTGNGIIVGMIGDSRITNCNVNNSKIEIGYSVQSENSSNVKGSYYSYTGAICGSAISSVINDCSSNTYISSYGYIGGISGGSFSTNIKNCVVRNGLYLKHLTSYSIDSDSDNRCMGGIVGLASSGSVASCTSYADLHYSSNAQCKDKNLKPRIGQIIGLNQSGVNLNSNAVEADKEIDSGNLQSWWEWFTTYNQKEYVKNESCGKIE